MPNAHRSFRARRARGDCARGIVTVVARSSGTYSDVGICPASSRMAPAGGSRAAARTISLRNARADAGRSSRSRTVACSTASSSPGYTPGATVDGAGTFADRCWYAMASEVSPENGVLPVSSSNITTPSA